MLAADPKEIAQMYDFGAVAGSITDLTSNGIAVSTRKASSKHLKLGDLVPVKYVKTGVVPLRVEFIYKNNGLVGDYMISLANYERNFAQQLDFQIFAKLKPGVSAAQGRKAIEPLVDALSERGAEGQRAVQGRPEETGEPGPDPGVRACCSSP